MGIGSNKQTILIVDDSLLNLKILSEELKEEYNVLTATNGKDAINIISSKNTPSLILLDVLMPDIDGYTLCKKIRSMPIAKDIPIIFVTSMDRERDEEYGLSLGAIDYIKKPCNIAIIKARIKNHLELKMYRDLYKEISMLDGLTQIPNRRRFDDKLKTEWEKARQNGEYISVLLVDIDYFKSYNDSYGHLIGDEILKKVAVTIKETMDNPTFLAARWGGEEFACVLPETNKAGAIDMGERIRENIMKLNIEHITSLTENVLTVSVGSATVIPGDEDFNFILNRADEALYRAKSLGRNIVVAL